MTDLMDGNVNQTERDPIYRVHILPSGYLVMAIYLTIVGTVATIGNATTLCVLLKFGTFKKRAINFLLVNLAFSDLCISFTGYPLTTISSYAGRWVFGYAGCQFNGFSVFALSSSAIGTHAALAVYRYIYVCKHNLRPKLSNAVTLQVIVFLWCHALFWAITPLIGWSRYEYEPFGTSCSIDWISRTVNNYSFMLLTTISNYVIPVVIMIICYTQIARRSRKVDPLRVEDRDRSMRVINKFDKMEMKIDIHVTKMCVAMTCAFLIAWTPYAVWSLWMPNNTVVVGPISSTLPTMLAKSSCMMNPLVYLASSSTFRRDVLKILRAGRSRSLASGAETQTVHIGEQGDSGQASGRYYVKNNRTRDGKSSFAIYFDKKQIFIGDVTPEGIEKDSSLAQRDPDKISVRFSSQGAISDLPQQGSTSHDTEKSMMDLPKSAMTTDCPSTSDSEQRSRVVASPIFN